MLSALVGRLEPTRFVHNDKAILVQRVHERFRLHIVTGAVTVRAHFFHEPHFVTVDIVGYRFSGKSAIGVTAQTFYLIVFVVYEQPFVGIENVISEAETRDVLVGLFSSDVQFRNRGVHIRLVRTP